MTQTWTLRRPDDNHVHLREGTVMRAVTPFTASVFGHALVMPNLKDPVTTTAKAKAYRETLRAAAPVGAVWTPLMTLYLTDLTDPDDVQRGFQEQVLTAVKFYPAGVTTNAERGLTSLRNAYPVFERMQKIGMPLSIHGEVADPDVDVFDREAVFVERVLTPLRRDFQELKIVMEHLTTEAAAAYVRQEGARGRLAGTITAHHLHMNRNRLFEGGLRPHAYCLPVAKRERDRQALIAAATSGEKMFFLGTDSAPHVQAAKEGPCAAAGVFTAPLALPLYAQVFDEAGKLEQLEAFASLNGAAFYERAVNADTITLEKVDGLAFKPILTEEGQNIILFAPSAPLSWRIRDNA
ncbi:MAG: dihydroorotase [Alphaproteobacteria bacterium]|nr:dihydroorotase [Alphaproteobacteria bacterium]